MQELNIGVIVGSTRQQRFSDKPAQWIFERAKKEENVSVELLDLRDYPMPFYDSAKTPSMITDGKYENEVVQKWADKIRSLDAFIVVTPEYNHSFPAVLKNALDCIYYEWQNKAVGFVSYGSVGGSRAVEHLRQVCIELHMASARDSVHIPGHTFFPILMGKAQWQPENDASLNGAADKMLSQLLWWGRALKVARK